MGQIVLRYQISIFGSFDEIKPTADNIKFFIEKFSDKGFIPNQFTEVSLEIKSESNKGAETTKNVETSRLRLSDSDKKWDIRFASDRIDFLFVNSNIGQIQMIEKDVFIAEVSEFINRINEKHQIKSKRVGLITQYLYDDIDLNKVSNVFQNKIAFFNQKPIIDWNSKTATRHKIEAINEVANLSMDVRRIQRPLKVHNGTSLFDGILLNIDINTLAEK
ncbi:MAG: hypothetical protein JSS64_00450 [Bacteroidetes bacterium]|nr:hypothetical protein [Bacteroidota bacterium]